MRFIPLRERFGLDRLWPRRRGPANEAQAPSGDSERAERLYWTVLEDVRDLIQPPPARERRPRRRQRRRRAD